LPPADLSRDEWRARWPTRRPGHSWDAIGCLKFGMTHEWLLVEAKANVEEMVLACHAFDAESRSRIERSLNATKAALGGAADRDWPAV
jgi:hypothetical protein